MSNERTFRMEQFGIHLVELAFNLVLYIMVNVVEQK